MTQKTCRHCSAPFEITPDDLAFLDKLSPVIAGKKQDLPPPTLCPDCRQQRRCAQGNQLNLYERKCDLTGSMIISNYHPSSPYKVYRQEDWYAEKWDPFQYGRAFDFSRPFFDQWQELSLVVPRPSLQRGFAYDENADYTNYAGKNKNCYLIFDSDENRDCYYSYSLQHSENCMDCYRVRNSELCYGVVDSVKCYNCAYLQDCDNCSESAFLKNCIGCKHCLMCSNLRNKEYHVENKPVTKEQFEQFRAMLGSYSRMEAARKRFDTLKLALPQKYIHGVQNEEISGDYLTNCKNAYHCFDSNDLWDCRYVYQAFMAMKNSMDVQECGDSELVYDSCFCGYNAYKYLFTMFCLGEPAELLYSSHSPHSKHLFGCVSMIRKQYCILNKQYTKEEYEVLVPKIIEHMRNDGAAMNPSGASGSWGEFFPVELSTFAYNETLAQDHFPMTKNDVTARGWKWLDDVDARDRYKGPVVELPDDISSATDDICKKILTCAVTKRQYKIIPQELKLYQQMRIPLPRTSFFQRHKERMSLRNPRTLWNRKCAKCKRGIETSYAPERPEIVYCEDCYLASVS